jgi:hypothetical protein
MSDLRQLKHALGHRISPSGVANPVEAHWPGHMGVSAGQGPSGPDKG